MDYRRIYSSILAPGKHAAASLPTGRGLSPERRRLPAAEFERRRSGHRRRQTESPMPPSSPRTAIGTTGSSGRTGSSRRADFMPQLAECPGLHAIGHGRDAGRYRVTRRLFTRAAGAGCRRLLGRSSRIRQRRGVSATLYSALPLRPASAISAGELRLMPIESSVAESRRGSGRASFAPAWRSHAVASARRVVDALATSIGAEMPALFSWRFSSASLLSAGRLSMAAVLAAMGRAGRMTPLTVGD